MLTPVSAYIFAIETLVRVPADHTDEIKDTLNNIFPVFPPHFAEAFVDTTETLEMDGVFPCGELRAAWYYTIRLLYPSESLSESMGIDVRAKLATFKVTKRQLVVWKSLFRSKIVRGNPYTAI